MVKIKSSKNTTEQTARLPSKLATKKLKEKLKAQAVNLSVDNLSVSQTLSVTGSSSLGGNTTLNNTGVLGTFTTAGPNNIRGNTLLGNVGVSGTFTASGPSRLQGNTVIDNLNVIGPFTTVGPNGLGGNTSLQNVGIGGSLSANGPSYLAGNTTLVNANIVGSLTGNVIGNNFTNSSVSPFLTPQITLGTLTSTVSVSQPGSYLVEASVLGLLTTVNINLGNAANYPSGSLVNIIFADFALGLNISTVTATGATVDGIVGTIPISLNVSNIVLQLYKPTTGTPVWYRLNGLSI